MKLQLLGIGESRLFSLINKHLISDNVEFSFKESSELENRVRQFDGIIIGEPIDYLVQKFIKEKHSYTKINDFVETSIKEVTDYYEGILCRINENKTLVLSDSELLISLLTVEFQYKASFAKIPYSELLSTISHNSVNLIEQDRLHIIDRLSDSYSIYKKLKVIFSEQWRSIIEKANEEFKTDKCITIHVGPPKTGTSAVQAWLNSQSDNLSAKGIYYPKHKTDRNGISSGNFSSLISTSSKKSLFFDRDKLSNLIDELDGRRERSLLLSSEHFYYFLPWLFLYCKNAKFIFYIRHPLSVLESGYNQQVKRHRKTEEFRAPSKVKFNHLETLVTIASKFEVDVMYRFYNFSDSKSNNIFKDFSTCFDDFIEPPIEFKKINTKFSPGSLELMRLSNSVASRVVLEELDLILQRMSESHIDFSLMDDSHFNRLNNFLDEEKEKLISRVKTLDREQFSRLLTSYKNAETLDYEAVTNDFRLVIEYLCRNHKLIAYYLYYQSYQCQNIKLYSSLNKHLTSKLSSAIAFYSLPKVIRLKKAIQRFKLTKLRNS